jgi:hypothetical protein
MERMPSAAPTPPPPERPRLGDTLAEKARAGAKGGRAKWIVWAIFGIPVLVIGLLQAFGVLSNPVAEKVLENKRRRLEERGTPAPQTPPGK